MIYSPHTSKRRARRHARIRARVAGTGSVPRLSVYRSNRFMHVQLIDDERGATVLSLRSDRTPEKGVRGAHALGALFAAAALEKKVERVVFDRGGFLFTGRVRAFATGAREGGLKF